MINQVNAKQLFLLCALRMKPVEAKNSTEYIWTIQHDSEFHQRFLKIIRKEGNSEYEKIKQEVKTEVLPLYPVQRCEYRKFIIYRTDLGFDLTDRDGDMAWYMPGGLASDWSYPGMFELEESLSEKEEFFLFDLLEITKPT